MNKSLCTILLTGLAICLAPVAPSYAEPQSDASAASALSAMPLASVVIGGSVVAGSVVALPVALAVSGATLVVRSVELSGRGMVCVLERASDGAQVSLEIAGSAVGVSVLAVGTSVTVSVIGAGAVLSAAGQVIAFVPNTLGRALLHNERLTY